MFTVYFEDDCTRGRARQPAATCRTLCMTLFKRMAFLCLSVITQCRNRNKLEAWCDEARSRKPLQRARHDCIPLKKLAAKFREAEIIDAPPVLIETAHGQWNLGAARPALNSLCIPNWFRAKQPRIESAMLPAVEVRKSVCLYYEFCPQLSLNLFKQYLIHFPIEHRSRAR